MKQSISTQKQQDYWLRKTEDGKHYVRLRKNHESYEQTNDDETPTIYWRCNEIELKIPLRDNVQEYVEANFDTLYDTYMTALELFDIGE